MKKKITMLLVALGIIILPLTTNASILDDYEHKNFKETLAAEDITLKNSSYKESDDQITIYMFRGQGCTYCRAFLNFLNDNSEEYGKYFKLVSFEVWNDSNNNDLLTKVSNVAGTTAEGVPYIIIGETVFPGYITEWDDTIKSTIKTEYEKSKSDRVDMLAKTEKSDAQAEKEANAPITKTIIWNLVFVIIATATIITVNTIQHKKVLNEIETLKTKKTK